MQATVRRKLSMAGRVLRFERSYPSTDASHTGVVDRLEQLLSRANELASRELLAPGGRIVVDDWAWEEVDVATMAWFTSFLDLAEAQEWLELPTWPRGDEALGWWRAEREEGENAQPFYLELAAARRHFHIEPPQATPFFYRYVWRALRGTVPDA